ncbi:unnamed protein product [Rotaria magnacalcarata]|uniref:Uncharacterized protein n=1 Tax=Rotaria magnacalcarata TaxID=392030 RepID=A0A816RAY6_9BILA|nr:unnamed protein product [Rotaria magnacalcarata]
MWMNQLPAQFNGRLLQLDESTSSSSSSFENSDFGTLQYRSSVLAIEIESIFTTAQAVNNDTKTCWKIHRSIRPGDLFGIDFQIIQTNRALSFSIEYLHQKSLQTKLQISISLDSQTWVQFSQQNQSGAIYDKENLVIFHTGLFPVGFQIFRFIKFVSLEDTETSFHICDVRLLHNKTFE